MGTSYEVQGLATTAMALGPAVPRLLMSIIGYIPIARRPDVVRPRMAH